MPLGLMNRQPLDLDTNKSKDAVMQDAQKYSK
jgi:hypothetical protein